MSRTLLIAFGTALLFAGAIGPFSYADDVRHSGEAVVSLGLTLSGLFLLSPSMSSKPIAKALPVAAVTTLAGMLIGVLTGATVIGVLIGIGSGLLAAGVFSLWNRHPVT